MTSDVIASLAADSRGTADDRPPVVFLHGLSYDRRQWEPLLAELSVIDPGRRTVAFDLPGHGDSPRFDSYGAAEVIELLHQGVTEAGLTAPVLVGHSLGGVLATIYAASHPAHTVINVDQPLLAGGFAQALRQWEPVLRSPDHGQVWNSLLARMEIDLLPASAQELLRTATTPRPDLLLGYWSEIISTPEPEFTARRSAELSALRANGTRYHHVSGHELDPGYRSWLESLLPEVTVTVLPGSGHFPHLAHPGELAKIVRAD